MGNNALNIACQHSDYEMAELLLQHKADQDGCRTAGEITGKSKLHLYTLY